jgi:glutamate formiminotransferase/formiminotetrahydrofolate cyclodeaminase
METALKSYSILAEMADKGNPASISDVGVGLLALRACIDGAAMNVRINLAGLKDEKLKSALRKKTGEISAESESRFNGIRQVVETKLG